MGNYIYCLLATLSFMIDYKVEDCKDKLSKLSKEEALRVIYGWVKQEFISLRQFKELISYCC